jgi:outer membrane protein assembly factor BamB
MRLIALVLLAGMLAASQMSAAGWPSFRGDNGSGIAEGSDKVPVEFSRGKNLQWRVELPEGTSSPVFARDRLFITAQDKGELFTYCIDSRTGRTLWRRAIPQQREEKLHQLNSPASSTPVTDGANVYVFFGDFGLISYGADGNERWRIPLGPFNNLHGMAVSPVLAGERLILSIDQDTNSYLLAVHKDTGRQLWKTARPMAVHGFATPTLFTPPGGKLQIIVPGSYVMASYDAATGEELWTVRGLTWQIKTTAVASGDTIYATAWAPGADAGESKPLPPFEDVAKEIDANGDGKLSPGEIPPKYKHGGSWQAIDLDHDGFLDARDWRFYRARRAARNVTMAVRPGSGRGDITEAAVLWQIDRFVPQVSSPLFYNGLLYTVKDGGIFSSIDPQSGRILKTARIAGAIDAYYSSPIAAGGRIYVANETGKIAVIRPGAEWETLTVNDVGENIYATPAVLADRLYIRTASAFYCFAAN